MPESATKTAGVDGPPKFDAFHHVSIPCRDLEEGIRFYTEVMGGRVRVKEPFFASIQVADAAIGIGAEGCSYVERSAEYPHFAFHAGGEELQQMKDWLKRCGIPSTIFWTRMGVEALMFFRDPSGNLIELYCEKGFKGATGSAARTCARARPDRECRRTLLRQVAGADVALIAAKLGVVAPRAGDGLPGVSDPRPLAPAHSRVFQMSAPKGHTHGPSMRALH